MRLIPKPDSHEILDAYNGHALQDVEHWTLEPHPASSGHADCLLTLKIRVPRGYSANEVLAPGFVRLPVDELLWRMLGLIHGEQRLRDTLALPDDPMAFQRTRAMNQLLADTRAMLTAAFPQAPA